MQARNTSRVVLRAYSYVFTQGLPLQLDGLVVGHMGSLPSG